MSNMGIGLCEDCGEADGRPYTFYHGKEVVQFYTGRTETVIDPIATYLCDGCVLKQRRKKLAYAVIGALVTITSLVLAFTADMDLLFIVGLVSLVAAGWYGQQFGEGREYAAKDRAISLFKTRTKKVQDTYWHDDPRPSASTRPKTTSAKRKGRVPPTFVDPEQLTEMQATLTKMIRRAPPTPGVPPAATPQASQPSRHGNAEFHVFTFSSPAAAMELELFFGMIKGSDDDEHLRFFQKRTLIMSAANVPARDIGGKEYELSGLDGKWLLLMPADVVPPLKRSKVWSRCRLVADVDMSIGSADMHAPHKKMLDVLLNYVRDNWGELSGD